MRPQFLGSLIALCMMGILPGCSTVPEARLEANEATCHVCRYNNDLACVCVRVAEGTPRTEYNGQPYYFCSEDCRSAFCKKPQKYLPTSASAQKPPQTPSGHTQH